MVLVENAARHGTVFYHHDSKDVFSVLLCHLLPESPTLESLSLLVSLTQFLKNFAEKQATVIIGYLQATLG